MATATTKTVRTVSLHMTEDEARVLMAVFQCIGGMPDQSPRGVIDDLSNALRTAGVSFFTSLNSENFPFETHARSLIFKNGPLREDEPPF